MFNLSDTGTVYWHELGALIVQNTVIDYTVSINYQQNSGTQFFVIEQHPPDVERSLGSFWLYVDRELAVPGTYVATLTVDYIDSESGENMSLMPI